MSEQPDLFGTPEKPASQLEADFWKFHAENPHVYRLFCKFAARVLARGYSAHSARDIIHRIRWETSIETGDDEFKINDHHSPYYGRLWMRDHPQHDGFFRTRTVAASGQLHRKGDKAA
jgi:hypothetical protein